MVMNLYPDAARILDRNPAASARVLSEALNCAKSTADNLRSFYFTSEGDPKLMRKKANEASIRSKRKSKTGKK